MNFVGDGHYKLNRRLLLLVGLWPYENSVYKYCQMILCNILIIFMMFCQIRYLMYHVEEDWNMLKDKIELGIIERYTCIGSMSFNDKLLQGYTSEKQAIIICKRIIEAVHIHKRALKKTFRYITRWQGAPLQAQKLLPIIMQRSLRSCKMTVGGMFVPSLEGFATVNAMLVIFILCIYNYFAKITFIVVCFFVSIIYVYKLFFNEFQILNKYCHFDYTYSRRALQRSLENEKVIVNISVKKKKVSIDSVSSEMKFPEEQYFRLNRILLSTIGLWPHDDSKARHIRFILSSLIMVSFISSQVKELRDRVRNNWRVLTDNQEIEIICKQESIGKLSTIFIISKYQCSIQWYNAPLKTQKQILYIIQKTIKSYHIDVGGLYNPSLEGFTMIKKLIDEINYHWNSTKCKEELKILQQYSYITKLLTIMVTGILYSSLCIFVMIQILPKFLDIVLPLNESRPLKLLGLATFFFDQEKYFIPIMMHMIIALLVESSTIIATETTTLVYLQHACGLFKITR
ncbi:hypothetical protein ALC62_03631 [Cyphomyrmex costatus]|uniref:Odorant receptor n=1 Tax=Cyphomyrmex costatus TaxID=456900 RepID=A0A195CXP2_9HYME|nr:hypothetical protein ALC62_03631 [Cyphomyrmex costatus]